MINSADIFKARILILDEQPASATRLEEVLREAGYAAVSSTPHPHEVGELHRDNRYSLIVLDFQTPGLDAKPLLEDLQTLEIGCHLPVLVITDGPQQRQQALKAGAGDFLGRPFDRAELLMQVHHLLEVRLLRLEMLTRRDQAEERSSEAQRMEIVGQLAGSVAHDFSNTLAVIMGYNDLLLSELAPEIPLQKYAREIQRASERAAGLTLQLLGFDRMQSGASGVLDLNLVVNDMTRTMRRLIDDKIELSICLEGNSEIVKAEYSQIGQLLLNLVVNARDSMPQGGRITISTANVTLDGAPSRFRPLPAPGNYVMLNISDTGTGMTEKARAHLYRAFPTPKPPGKGSGFGLTNCETIVRQTGGHICIGGESGKGTSIQIYFPRVGHSLRTGARLDRTGPWPRGTETLLVVEDDASVRDLAQHVLHTQGYEVLTAWNGQDALHVVREHQGEPIRLVFTDVVMPLMGGKIMADWLRSERPDLKVLFTSGFTDKVVRHHGVQGGGADFLPKPYTPATLSNKVREMLDHSGGPGLAPWKANLSPEELQLELV